MSIPISIDSPEACRAISKNPDFRSAELYKAEADGHKYKPGETRTLTGLTDFPEYNGQQVKITTVRMDAARGKSYYIEGKINDVLNWIYESRLI